MNVNLLTDGAKRREKYFYERKFTYNLQAHHVHIVNIYLIHRFGLANSIYTYLRLKFRILSQEFASDAYQLK